MTPQGNNNLNFGLARDHVVHLETAGNLCTGRPDVKAIEVGRFSLETCGIGGMPHVVLYEKNARKDER